MLRSNGLIELWVKCRLYIFMKSCQSFGKNIGLISSYIVHTLTADTIYKKVLLDYHINL